PPAATAKMDGGSFIVLSEQGSLRFIIKLSRGLKPTATIPQSLRDWSKSEMRPPFTALSFHMTFSTRDELLLAFRPASRRTEQAGGLCYQRPILRTISWPFAGATAGSWRRTRRRQAAMQGKARGP